jgi:hypothetical protein
VAITFGIVSLDLERILGLGYSVPVSKVRIPDDVMDYFRKTGSLGGKTRAKKYSKEQLSEMGKKGGRPKGGGKKRSNKKTVTKKGGKSNGGV